MALYIQLQRMEAEQNLDIFGCVRAMRCKRNCMVQTEVKLLIYSVPVRIHCLMLISIYCAASVCVHP